MDQLPSPIEPPATPVGERGVRILRPLRIRDFALLFGGTTVSLFGDGIYIVALAWQVYDLSNVPTALSAVGVAWTLPMVIFLLIGGVLGDRFDRRRLMIAGDAIRAVAIAAIAVLALAGVIELWHVIAFTVLYGVGEAIFAPNFQAVVPDVVPQRLLVEANSLQQLAEPVAFRFAGPAIGGLLVAAFGTGAAFAVDASTFVVSMVCVALMRPLTVAREDSGASVLEDIREGTRFVRSQPWLWGTLLSAALTLLLFLGPFEVLLPFIVRNELGGDADVLGVILGASGVGAIVFGGPHGPAWLGPAVRPACVRGLGRGGGLSRRLRAGDSGLAGRADRVRLGARLHGGERHLGDDDPPLRPDRAAGAGQRPRLVGLDRAHPDLVRDRGPHRRGDRRGGDDDRRRGAGDDRVLRLPRGSRHPRPGALGRRRCPGARRLGPNLRSAAVTEDSASFYVPEGDGFASTELTRGPWDPGSQHAGPPAALIGREIEALPAAAPMQVGRITFEILRPVPIAPLRVAAEVVRPGRRVEMVEATLHAGEELLIRARGWRLREGEVELPAGLASTELPAVGSESPQKLRPAWAPLPPQECPEGEFFHTGQAVGYHTAMEYRFAEGPSWTPVRPRPGCGCGIRSWPGRSRVRSSAC